MKTRCALLAFLDLGSCLLVLQPSRVINVTEGDNATLSCRFYLERNEAGSSGRVRWWKDGNRTSRTFPVPDLSGEGEFSADLHIHSVRRDQRGCYVCEVALEIPVVRRASGNGTLLQVTECASCGQADTATSPSPLVTWWAAMCAATLLLLLLLAGGLYGARKACRLENYPEISSHDRQDAGTETAAEYMTYTSVHIFKAKQPEAASRKKEENMDHVTYSAIRLQLHDVP
ncbi:uncharacterized protein LOC114800136 [Denticeps clupeoides]|uniref:uncharacterized protein LOC114800136 n=1 Tax=Denticeps clupeoides TaxID=299321 RepID=UPI0010A57B76|nr:transmembrane and immunoglobulin domain-containing protein 2 [Denticeps clupeoides]XP_028853108.1 transmembrane and immunoglobulin domain-containing protein 2 [Denticeps clupeoides]XP_028853109.1 transmembrane and immunoglobulin domain-containing protein 2 [Denticeps clupeoides]XP_028853110.1 transmembrane and immunoglobulin domain-containing protein 2 [Denticeps clupeoides]